MKCPETPDQPASRRNDESRATEYIDRPWFIIASRTTLRPLCPYRDYDGDMLSTGKELSCISS
jgi:hypothetical protein